MFRYPTPEGMDANIGVYLQVSASLPETASRVVFGGEKSPSVIMSLFQNLRRDAQMLSLVGISPYHLARFIGTQTCLRRQAQFFFPVSFHSMSLEHSCSFQESCFNGRSMKTQILAPLALWTPPQNLSPVPGYKRKDRFSCVSNGIREKKLFFLNLH